MSFHQLKSISSTLKKKQTTKQVRIKLCNLYYYAHLGKIFVIIFICRSLRNAICIQSYESCMVAIQEAFSCVCSFDFDNVSKVHLILFAHSVFTLVQWCILFNISKQFFSWFQRPESFGCIHSGRIQWAKQH